MIRLFSSVLVLSLSVIVAIALPGELDLTFNGTGISRIAFDEGDDRGFATALQQDGKIVVAGRTFNGSDYDIGVARYNVNGTLDSSFGENGFVTTAVNGDDQASGLVIQPDGKIVVAGFTSGVSGQEIVVVRYDPNGFPDSTFGTDGIVTTAIGGLAFAFSVAIDASDRIIVAGSALVSGNLDFAVVRYLSDGSLDSAFDGDGIATTGLTGGSDIARSVVVQPDGKILAAGSTETDFALVRYEADGSLDTSFNLGGTVITSIGPSSDVAFSVQIDTFGSPARILAVGYAFDPTGSGTGFDVAIARYELDGTLDISYGTNGIVTTSVANDAEFAYAAAIQQTNGKLVIAGSSTIGNRRFLAARYNDDGSLDSNFGTAGIVTAAIQVGDAEARAIAITPSGEIILAGHSSSLQGQNLVDDVSVVRLDANGALDSTFDGDGIVITPWQSGTSRARAVAVQPDGKLLVAGTFSGPNGNKIGVTRFNSNGTLDSSFAGGGKLRTSIDGEAYAVAVQPDGKIVLAGSTRIVNDDFVVIRLLPDGSFDTSFNGTGFVITSLTASNDVALGLAIQPDGKIIAAGYAVTAITGPGDLDFALVRYNADGTLDTTFSSDGRVLTPVGTSTDIATSVVLQPDGKIVVAGSSFVNFLAFNDFAAVRYNADGTLDTSFGTGGKVITPVGTNNDEARALAIQPDGKLVVVGESSFGFTTRFAVVRLTASGSLDTSFGASGVVTTPVGLSSSGAFAVAIQTNGKIVVGGYALIGASNAFAIVRYNLDGTIDFPFAENRSGIWGTNGTVTLDLTDANDTVYGLAIDANGRVVVVGESGGIFGVIRLQGDLAPTSATVSISGRVLSVDGRGVPNIRVAATGENGLERRVFTNSFGYYRIEDIEAGRTVVITAQGKQWSFSPRVVTAFESVGDIDLIGIEDLYDARSDKAYVDSKTGVLP
jgi:uncharacterized delta-60 repeat protein